MMTGAVLLASTGIVLELDSASGASAFHPRGIRAQRSETVQPLGPSSSHLMYMAENSVIITVISRYTV